MEETLGNVHRVQQRRNVTHAPSSAGDDDVITFYDCATHNVRTSNYIEYLQHLVLKHEDFRRTNMELVLSGTKGIQYKEGIYSCNACELHTAARVIFKVSCFSYHI